MIEFTIRAVQPYLRHDTRAFYSVPYVGFNRCGNPNYLNVLKNTFSDKQSRELDNAVSELKKVLISNLLLVKKKLDPNPLTVCVVPRAKANLMPDQLLFRRTIKEVVSEFPNFIDGTDYMQRHTNTRTTHLRAVESKMPNYNNGGAMPYSGITRETCNLNPSIRGSNILLVDDIYTPLVYVDEDAIQSLLDIGAQSVVFYSVAKTRR